MKTIILAVLILAVGPACAGERVEYHQFGGDTYGSDGSRSHDFAGDRYITDRNGHRTRCHEFAGTTTCEAE